MRCEMNVEAIENELLDALVNLEETGFILEELLMTPNLDTYNSSLRLEEAH
jgi:hypothetical protein